tara:strand:+ start:137 stop:373 length:237 start_codon:yes stop_codon:yes gene_type:complete
MEIDELPGQLLQLKRRQNLNSQESGAQSNPELGTLMKARKPEILILGQPALRGGTWSRGFKSRQPGRMSRHCLAAVLQ